MAAGYPVSKKAGSWISGQICSWVFLNEEQKLPCRGKQTWDCTQQIISKIQSLFVESELCAGYPASEYPANSVSGASLVNTKEK